MELIRKYSLGIWPILATIVYPSCSSSVSDELLKTFEIDYPEARGVEWTKNRKFWKVTFYEKEFYYKSLCYRSTGEFISIEYEICLEDVPRTLLTKVAKVYPIDAVTAVFKRIEPDSFQYIFEIIYQGKMFGLIAYENGDLNTIAGDDERFTSRLIIEND